MRENIVMYSFTSSKLGANLMNHVSPAGSYRTLIIRCLDSSAEDSIAIPAGTSRCVFDNNQIIGKTYTIKRDNKVPTSVMCSAAYISLNEELKPSKWMWNSPPEKEGSDLLVFSSDYDDFFRDTRDKLLKQQIQKVYDEHNQQSEDHIDKYVQEIKDAQTEKICIECGGANDVTYRICRACKGSLVKPPEPELHLEGNVDPFHAFEDVSFTENGATVTPGEPEFVNPNSFDTIVTVLRGLGRRGGIRQYGGEEREWMFVECDGLPYTIMRSLIDNVWFCRRCKECHYGQEKLEEHPCNLIGKGDVYREFSWVVQVMGLLHLEMNVSRSFIKLNWETFVSTIAYNLGFKSDKAQKYCQKGSDHHKTFTLLEICYLAFSKELVTPYVKCCIRNNVRPTVERYWQWQEDSSCPNYIYIQQMTHLSACSHAVPNRCSEKQHREHSGKQSEIYSKDVWPKPPEVPGDTFSNYARSGTHAS
ncbi:uncharacterized protein LOC135153566 [Lytechinus pictus]|uniref:uncharacterized protein LOC135153566 n=1 Tax=Lytechinus pictus TaxID=7653 RepID=UPI0030B9D300